MRHRKRARHRHLWTYDEEYAVPLPPEGRWRVHYLTFQCACGRQRIEIVAVA